LRRIKTVIEKVGKRWNRGRRKEHGEKNEGNKRTTER